MDYSNENNLPPNQTPQNFSNLTSIKPATLSNKPKKRWILSAIIVLIIIAAAISGYFVFRQSNIFGKKPYSEEKVLSGILSGVSKISSATYSLTFKGVSEKREPSTKSFISTAQKNRQPLYDRDQDKFRDLRDILVKLKTYFNVNKKYPASLSIVGVPDVQQQKYDYTVKDNGSDFSLIAEFETGEAVDEALRSKGSIISGKKVSFSNKSSTYFYFSGKASESGLFKFINSPYFTIYFPTDYSSSMSISGATQKVGGSTNGQLDLSISAKIGGFSIEADVQGKKIGDDFYILANKFPQFFFSPQAVIGKWIKITPQDIAGYGGNYIGINTQNFDTEYRQKKDELINSFLKILKIAEDNKALQVKNSAVRENIENRVAYRYDLEINKDNIANFYKDAVAEFQETPGYLAPKFSQATLDYLEGPEFDDFIDYLNNNSSLSVWIAPDGIPIKYSYTLKVVPSDLKGQLAERQIKQTVEIILKNVNKEAKIDKPAEFISLEDAVVAVSGITREEYVFQNKIRAVEKVRGALNAYKATAKLYPDSLNDLTRKYNDFLQDYGSDRKLLDVVPEGFVYKKSGDGYVLNYEVLLPPVEKISSLYAIYKTYYSDEYKIGQYGGRTSKLGLKITDGKNTATDKYLSNEAFDLSSIDSDGDKISDSLEQYIGSNKTKKDTDSDGYSDYDEIISGNNPLGPGKLNLGQ